MTQVEALTILKTGANTFITGPAGSGKTHVINQYIAYLKDHHVPLGITASTGIAATHMGGVTIHSWAGIGVRDWLSEEDIAEIGERAYVRKKILEAKVLIIDEVSMLHHFRLDLVERVIRYIKKNEDPFGGIQVVLCGDFFQLPPVSRIGEPEARFIYKSDAWEAGHFSVCYLSENYRQGTDVSVTILNEIRSAQVSAASREHLRSRYRDPTQEKEISYDQDLEAEPTRLYTHNADVDAINNDHLSRVQDTEFVYEMTSKGKKNLVETIKKSCLAPEKLRLKKGARVMCVKNNFETGYVNGTLGVVVSCGFGVDPVIRTASSREYPEGRLITIEQATWKIEDEGKTIAEISQYPLRLAWAITVHKSQGMSLDALQVDLSRAFEPGMGYVALSRVRTLQGLTILGFSENALKVHPEVLDHDRHLRQLSEKAESIVSHTDEREIVRAQEEFLAKVAPLHSMGKKGSHAKAKKISTYDETARFIRDKKTLREIAKIRNMTVETIISHVEKLVSHGEAEQGLTIADIMYLKKEIAPPHFAKIEKALEEVSVQQENDDPPLLSPVKSKVGYNISFRDIQLARVLLGYIKKK